MRLYPALIILLFNFSGYNVATAKPVADPVPGGIALIKLETEQLNSHASFNNKTLAKITDHGSTYLLVGIPLSTPPGNHTVSIKTPAARFSQLCSQCNQKPTKPSTSQLKTNVRSTLIKTICHVFSVKKNVRQQQKNTGLSTLLPVTFWCLWTAVFRVFLV